MFAACDQTNTLRRTAYFRLRRLMQINGIAPEPPVIDIAGNDCSTNACGNIAIEQDRIAPDCFQLRGKHCGQKSPDKQGCDAQSWFFTQQQTGERACHEQQCDRQKHDIAGGAEPEGCTQCHCDGKP